MGDAWQLTRNDAEDGFELYRRGETLAVDSLTKVNEYGWVTEVRVGRRVFASRGAPSNSFTEVE